MNALAEDELLLQQRAKLMANAAWIQRQQMQLQLQRAHLNSDGDECHADIMKCDALKKEIGGHESVWFQRQCGEAESSLARDEACAKLAFSSPGPRLQSTHSTSQGTPNRRGSTDGKSPGILKRSTGRCAESFVVPRGGSVMQVQRRNALWQLRREQKLEEQRITHSEDFSECTFSPKIGEYPESIFSSSLHEASSGVEQFIQRQERARKLAREKRERGRADGSKWVYRLTVTEPFVLGRRPEVESLRPPVQTVLGAAREALLEGDPEHLRAKSGASDFAGDTSDVQSPLVAVASTVGVVLPPPGTFSSWRALGYYGGRHCSEISCESSGGSAR